MINGTVPASVASQQPPSPSPSPPLSSAPSSATSSASPSRQPASAAKSDGPEPSYSSVVTGYELYHHPHPFPLEYGGMLPEFHLAYETWGTLNAAKDNVILLTCGLSASSHAKSQPKNTRPGWWEKFIGPGRALDTDRFFVVCTNNLGGCYGSTGPSAIDPRNGIRYALRFPLLSVKDMVRAIFHLLDDLGIGKLHAVVGSSLGGMQSIAAAAMYPERVGRLVSISAAAVSHPMSIALRYAQRQVLMADPNFGEGDYYSGEFPWQGMKLAREIGTITYRSGPEWEQRFGRERNEQRPSLNADFVIESYLEHQGKKWCLQYDPNSMIIISKAMDLFTMEDRGVDGQPDLAKGMTPIQMPSLIMGVQSDILFPSWQQKQIADILREVGNQYVVYYELDALYGHDTFLIDVVNVGAAVKGHLEQSKDNEDLD